MNVARMNYFNEEDLRCQVLKGIIVDDVAQHEHELESAKEVLGNVEANQTKESLGIE